MLRVPSAINLSSEDAGGGGGSTALTKYLYPGGTPAAPGTIGITQSITVKNPFPDKQIACIAEVLVNDTWGISPWVLGSSGSWGVSAHTLQAKGSSDTSVIVKSGGAGPVLSSASSGAPFTTGNITTPVPYRVKVWTID